MGNRRKIRRFNVTIIILFNILLCKVNFQSLNLPKNSYNLSSHGSSIKFACNISDIANNYNYSTTLLKYPDNIYLYNISIKNKYHITILDYGTFEDKINNNVLHSFQSYELLGMSFYSKSINEKYKIAIAAGVVYSKIDKFYSNAIFTDIGFFANSKKKNLNLNLTIKNLGIVINEYSNSKEYMPIKIQFGILKVFQNQSLVLAYDFLYDTGYHFAKHIASLKKELNNNLFLIMGINSINQDLKINNTMNDLLAGVAIGVIIENDMVDVGLGTSYLGPAGYVYGLTFSFK